VVAALSATPIAIPAVVERLYADVDPVLHPVAARSVWAHLRKLASEGRAASPDVDDPDGLWVNA